MKRLNQLGVIGPMEIAVIAVVVVLSGFVGMRIISVNNAGSLANSSENSDEDQANEITIKESEKDEAKEVELPKEEEKKEAVVEPKPEPTEHKQQDEEQKKDYTTISFTKGGGGQSGDTVSASALLESAQTGTCTVKFYNPPEKTIYIESQISNSRTCEGSADISEFGASGMWEVFTWFDSSDGTIKASNGSYEIQVTI